MKKTTKLLWTVAIMGLCTISSAGLSYYAVKGVFWVQWYVVFRLLDYVMYQSANKSLEEM
jgi:hypothetical protein